MFWCTLSTVRYLRVSFVIAHLVFVTTRPIVRITNIVCRSYQALQGKPSHPVWKKTDVGDTSEEPQPARVRVIPRLTGKLWGSYCVCPQPPSSVPHLSFEENDNTGLTGRTIVMAWDQHPGNTIIVLPLTLDSAANSWIDGDRVDWW